MKVKSESEVQFCLTLCNPTDCSLPGSSVYGIFQARGLEWGAIAFSRVDLSPLEINRLLVGIVGAVILPSQCLLFTWEA